MEEDYYLSDGSEEEDDNYLSDQGAEPLDGLENDDSDAKWVPPKPPSSKVCAALRQYLRMHVELQNFKHKFYLSSLEFG